MENNIDKKVVDTPENEPKEVFLGDKNPFKRKGYPRLMDMLAFLGIALVANLLVGTVMVFVFGGDVFQDDYADLHQKAYAMAMLYLFGMGLTLVGVIAYRKALKAPKIKLNLSLRGFNPILLLWGFILIVAVGIIIEPILALMPEIAAPPVGRGAWAILTTVVLAPIFEELLCRGYILGDLKNRYGAIVAILGSSLLFGILHLYPAMIVATTAVGLVLGYIYVASRSLWLVIALHALNNAVSYILMISNNYNVNLSELITNRTLYGVVYGATFALLAVAVYKIVRELRRQNADDEAYKNEVVE